MTIVDASQATMTIMQALIASLNKAADYNQNVQVAPAVILWPDKEGQWTALVPLLRANLRQFLTLGSYDPDTRTGPAIWIKCAIAHTLPEVTLPTEAIPILYLPGVSRAELRAVESCPKHLQPLAELQYRGVFWSQQNTRDWTVFAFLKSKDSLGLDVAQDDNTREAMMGALCQLAVTQIDDLRNKHLEAADFNALLTPDPVRDLLLWLNEPRVMQQQWDRNIWNAFCAICKDTYSFNPQNDGEITGGELLGQRHGNWATVWERFAESPFRYLKIPELLRRSMPQNINIFADQSSWPQHNEAQEENLRAALTKLKDMAFPEALSCLHSLENEHGKRRQWIWAELGQAPLAKALEYFTALAEAVKSTPGGASPHDMAEQYTAYGWKADAAVLQALACVERTEDNVAVSSAIRTIYTPWLERGAEHLQSLVQTQSYPKTDPTLVTPEEIKHGECLFFADGLRFDTGQILKAAMERRGWVIEGGWQWVALPTVTATSKPAVSPIASLLKGSDTGDEFRPEVKDTGKPLIPDRFRELIENQGMQYLKGQETGDSKGKAWTEFGDIDHYGHQHGAQLAQEIPRQIRNLVARIDDLLNAGWQRIRIITDHGWLLLPGGLPKRELSSHLTQTRWGRCAALKNTSQIDIPVASWFWKADVRIAMAPGIGCFKAGTEYAHGGMTLQECVTPTFCVSIAVAVSNATISAFKWIGLRCRVTVTNRADGMTVDIRKKSADISTSLANGGKPVPKDGPVSLAIEDDTTEGESAVIMLLDSQGNVICKQATIIGGNE